MSRTARAALVLVASSLAIPACRDESTRRSPQTVTPPTPHGQDASPIEPAPQPPAVARSFAGVEILASCAGARATGKRHQSYLFTFRVERESMGIFPFPEYTSQELFADFGGTQLRSRLEMTNDPPTCRHQAVLKLVRADQGEMGAAKSGGDGGDGGPWHILWAARPDEASSFRALEGTVRALVDSVDRSDIEPIRPFLGPASNLAPAELRALADDHRASEGGSFATAIGTSLLEEREGKVQIGGGGRRYAIGIVREAAGAWRLTDITWRRR